MNRAPTPGLFARLALLSLVGCALIPELVDGAHSLRQRLAASSATVPGDEATARCIAHPSAYALDIAGSGAADAASFKRFDFAASAPFDDGPDEGVSPQVTGTLPSRPTAAPPPPKSAATETLSKEALAKAGTPGDARPPQVKEDASKTGKPAARPLPSQPAHPRQASVSEDMPEGQPHAAAPAPPPSPEQKPAVRSRNAEPATRRAQRRTPTAKGAVAEKSWRPSNLENWPSN